MLNAADIIKILNLSPLPGEGGYYRETYRSSVKIQENRSASTSIYYLVTPNTFSALHRLPQDEVFHFYRGSPVEMLLIGPKSNHQLITLGSNLESGQIPQFVVPGGYWQGTKLAKGATQDFALLGTSVAPGFEFVDMQLGSRTDLLREFPDLSELIREYTIEE